MQIINQYLDNIDLSAYRNVDFGHDHGYFFDRSGREHYRMLVYYSHVFKGKLVFDIGTYRCLSAWALSDCPTTQVISYDVLQHLNSNPQRANIEYKIGNVLKDKRLLDARLILVDTYHDGLFEAKIVSFLKSKGWKGTMIFDDIHLNDKMKAFWKTTGGADFTFVGHYTGTGILSL